MQEIRGIELTQEFELITKRDITDEIAKAEQGSHLVIEVNYGEVQYYSASYDEIDKWDAKDLAHQALNDTRAYLHNEAGLTNVPEKVRIGILKDYINVPIAEYIKK